MELMFCYIYNNLTDHNPKAMATIPKTMLDKVYNRKYRSSPELRRECFSKAKAENVVKPPQKPVANTNI